MKIAALNIVFSLLLSSLCLAADNDRPDSHGKIIFRLADSLLQQVTADNPPLSAVSVALQVGEQPTGNYLKQQIIQSLVSRNVGVLLNQSSADTVVECTVRELSLRYGEVFSESFFGERKVERLLTLSLDITLSTVTSGTVLFSRNITAANCDTVIYSAINLLHEDSLPFTMVVQPQLSFFDSIIEPVIVTVAAGIAVYLFFTIRS